MLTPSQARKFFDPLNVRRLPARLTSDQTGALLSFSAEDIVVLVAAKLLQPLGKPKPSAVKWFAAFVVEQHASDRQWLDAATKAVSQYWRIKNARRLAAQHQATTDGEKSVPAA